jgi:hypothetical protein
MRWFLACLVAWLVYLVVIWIFGPDGEWVTWLSVALSGAGIAGFLWFFVFRAGPDD